MNIPESIVQAAEWGGGVNFNHVVIECDKEKEDVVKTFSDAFTTASIKEMLRLLEEDTDMLGLYLEPEEMVVSSDEDELPYGDDEPIEYKEYFWSFDPRSIESYEVEFSDTEEGLLVTYPILAYMVSMGDYILDYSQAVDKALEEVAKKYPQCSYYGYEGYFWSDCSSGEVSQHAYVKAGNDELLVYDYVGKQLTNAISCDEFWEQLEDCDLDFEAEEISAFLEAYKEYVSEDAFDKFEELIGV